MTLNLATQPFVNRRRFYTLSGMALSVLSLALVLLVSVFIRNFRNELGIRKQMRTVQQEIARLDTDQKRVEAVLKRPEASDILDRNDFLNMLIREKAVSWTRIFMDLEKVMPERVQTLSLHPTPLVPGLEGGSRNAAVPASWDGPLVMNLRLQVAAENIEGLITFMHRIEKPPFTNPVLNTENPNIKGDGGTGFAIMKDKDNLYNLSLSVTYVQ
jgi:Tfp pilus assembly protein PilN